MQESVIIGYYLPVDMPLIFGSTRPYKLILVDGTISRGQYYYQYFFSRRILAIFDHHQYEKASLNIRKYQFLAFSTLLSLNLNSTEAPLLQWGPHVISDTKNLENALNASLVKCLEVYITEIIQSSLVWVAKLNECTPTREQRLAIRAIPKLFLEALENREKSVVR